MKLFVLIKYCFNFTIKYVKYLYYGIKQRVVALFNLQLGLFDFIKSLFKVPFESYNYTKMELEYG